MHAPLPLNKLMHRSLTLGRKCHGNEITWTGTSPLGGGIRCIWVPGPRDSLSPAMQAADQDIRPSQEMTLMTEPAARSSGCSSVAQHLSISHEVEGRGRWPAWLRRPFTHEETEARFKKSARPKNWLVVWMPRQIR
jgi:hypothetical protein